jgi:hypothetical protein
MTNFSTNSFYSLLSLSDVKEEIPVTGIGMLYFFVSVANLPLSVTLLQKIKYEIII